jgi:hypothetical protein
MLLAVAVKSTCPESRVLMRRREFEPRAFMV